MDLIVETKNGKVEGFTENGVCKWYGIPYAKPPINELRFRRAVPCESWEGIKSCKKFQCRCVQFMKGFTILFTPESEDCLYLNIWRKDSQEKKLPVFVWIHGGYLHAGEGSNPKFDGGNFAREDILYIDINYRLGPLGCYDFSYYNKDRFDSNCCLSDQIMALKWINDNIEAFGGDSSNITICGESSGGASVCALLCSPAAKGLFNKVICQSGLPDGFHTKRSLKYVMDLYLKYLGITPENIDELTTLDVNRLKQGVSLLYKNLSKVYPGCYMPGILYDDLFPEDCYKSIKNGNTNGIKLIIGTCLNEGSFFYLTGYYPHSWKKVKEYCDLCKFDKDFNEVNKVYHVVKSEKQKVIDVNTDLHFLVGSIKLADCQCENNDVWMYQFNYAPRLLKLLGLNATHGIDVSICNKNAPRDYLWYMTPSKQKDKLMNEMFGCWVNFTKYGDPNGNHLKIKWEKYDSIHRKTYFFDEKSSLAENPAKEKFELWKNMQSCYK
ncbi:para-nitrobenzyl esterase [Neocallimastix lanati (nom. inval.)]|uniref:Carboxylic ester hydrolase n=1 Tax=Neocallimastix californiae TaxID=1754190 RepID=A0A1Y2FF18_9FUNG|nr:para-nitrobenzyl esterase [Neocallimastix sp. JGI-2020a]ORY82207.1 para-nitrobenzyl esterase [Neocallimastix californiae]|eukprot:ORY82207.1 para-nitrobenzyl esterase [Neocallimastix californiae]